MPLSEFIVQLLLALMLGSLVGLERQWHRRLVDLKTNALVSMGACLFMAVTGSPGGPVEPIRMAAQIVVGVGFIGGGLLWRQGTVTRGINTAATLWCSAAIGTLCGLGRLLEASVAAAVLVLANTVLRDVARRLNMSMGFTDNLTEQVVFDVECRPTDAVAVRGRLLQAVRHAELRGLTESRTAHGTTMITLTAQFEHTDVRTEIPAVLESVASPQVLTVSWRRP